MGRVEMTLLFVGLLGVQLILYQCSSKEPGFKSTVRKIFVWAQVVSSTVGIVAT